MLLQVTVLSKRTASCLGFPDIVKSAVTSIPNHFVQQRLQSLCFIVRADSDAIQTLQRSSCKVAITTITASCISFQCCGRQLTPRYLQLQHVWVDKRTLRQSQMHARQPVPMPNLHLTIQPKAHKEADTTSTLQAWQSNQSEINPVHFACQILCLAVSGEQPHYTSPEHSTTYHQSTSFAIHVSFFNKSAKSSSTALSMRSFSRPTAVCNG